MKIKAFILFVLLSVVVRTAMGQKKYVGKVDIFIRTSGDRGQPSPVASHLFSVVVDHWQTYPSTQIGHEHKVKEFLCFMHKRPDRVVDCMVSGGGLLINP